MHSQKYGLSRSYWSWILIVLICYSPSIDGWRSAKADQPNATELNEAVEALIEELNSSTFASREAASRRLLEIGTPALELLRKAEQHPAIEVRERSSRVYKEIEEIVFESIAKRFILEADGTQSFGLPAWDVFRSIAGDTRSSKLLFVTMLRSQQELATFVESASKAKEGLDSVAALENLASKATEVSERLLTQNHRGKLSDVGDTIGLLVACSMLSDSSSVASEVNALIVSSLYRRPHAEYFAKAGYSRCMRALTGKWIDKTQASLAEEVLGLSLILNIPEGATVARRHLDTATDREICVLALRCLARYGNEADIESVSKLLDEEKVIEQFTDRDEIGFQRDGILVEDMPPPGLPFEIPRQDDRTMIVRLNDIALAVCMLLGSEDLSSVFPKYEPDAANGFQIMDCAFPSDGQEYHKLAIARWKNEHPQFLQIAN